MNQVYRTLRVAPSDEGVLGVVIDAPPMNLIGPELVHDLVSLIGELDSGGDIRARLIQPRIARPLPSTIDTRGGYDTMRASGVPPARR